MSNLSAFMHANVEQIENYKFAASPRFKGGRRRRRGGGRPRPRRRRPAGAGARQKGPVHPAA